VLVTARKLNQLGVTDAELDEAKPVEVSVRAVAAPELVTQAGAGLTVIPEPTLPAERPLAGGVASG
jgi:hypothetical protein